MREEGSDDDEVDERIGDVLFPLVGVQLGGVAISDENGEELTRARYEANPRKVFSSQPSPSSLEEEIRLI
jgi:hypothetical protein